MPITHAQRLYQLANELALITPRLLENKGAGPGNRVTNDFIAELRSRAIEEFGCDHSEMNICGMNSLAVDYYFPFEETIVEIALGLRNPINEFEKNILKAVMARSMGNAVSRLVFLSKPGAIAECNQPGRLAVKEWVEVTHGVSLEIYELGA